MTSSKKQSRRLQLSAKFRAAVLVAIVAPLACLGSDDEPASGPSSHSSPPTIEIGDGNASGCDMPRPGCACEDEGMKVVCGEAMSEVGGQLVCGRGVSHCNDGLWGTCIINNTITLNPGTEVLTQGGTKACAQPCDIYCHTFVDDTSGEGDPNLGTTDDSGGITLVGSGGGGPAGPNCTGGVSGTCGHTICEVGGPLISDCDEAEEPAPSAPPSGTKTLFYEEFSNNSQGWSRGTEWQIRSAAASSNHNMGFPDPPNDATPNANNGVAGVDVNGNASRSVHGYRWLTSPVIDLSGKNDPVELSYFRWLNSDRSPWMENRVEVYDGSNWIVVWQGDVTDNQWKKQVHDISALKNANFRVRFGHRVGQSGVARVSSWNLDEVTITAAKASGPPPAAQVGGSCVATICAVDPSCCTMGWTASCVARVATTCGVTCQCDSQGAWTACYKDKFDHDGDGYSNQHGDCFDCDVNQNPGAYDFPGNGVDEDCDGTIDDEPTSCDGSIPLGTSNPFNYAKAMELCTMAPQAQPNTAKTWGVLDAKLVQADGQKPVHSRSKGVLSKFGASNAPFAGSRMAVFSSGTARAPGDPQYVNPSGQVASYNQNKSSAYPPGFPANAAGCPVTGGSAFDSSGLYLKIRVPTNARSFSYNFHYFSSEYPEWVCTAFNDHFVALLGAKRTNGNISFDTNGDPMSVNVGFFTVPGCSNCTSPILANTGFDGLCWGQICGGSTDWLVTTAPVDPGEEITMHFSTWDMGDHVWDSTVLIDNWQWSVNDATVATGKNPPPPPVVLNDGYFVRDYDASGVCPDNTTLVWGHWSWDVDTPGDSSIEFSVRTADSKALLDFAPELPLSFTSPPGPASMVGQNALAQAAPVDTQQGSLVVDASLADNGQPRRRPHVRIISHLLPSTDRTLGPTLKAYNLQFDCAPNQ